ncbi:hypothetical protein LNL84_09320 [Vibrio sp. ZSDZ34]|jgi:hypothetical protein|uniref:Uncharacterized protein n=1 Tax=Vibrio gelatinilyticus TaxID=2893468 RepID=A0A9X1WD85_9VIBR|nr:hypothetical protein [Vibrio gelatinilyticus]MCJ2377033.1 hypothetical protein [Vibrio gelatinilyticus]
MNAIFNSAHLTKTLMLTVWIVTGTVILQKLGVHDKWPAFLALIFFFEAKFDLSKLKNIFGAGVVGILMGMLIPTVLGALTPVVGGENAFYIYVAGVVLITIGMGPVAHWAFSYITFAYVVMCILHAKEVTAHGFTWMTVLALGGAMYIVGVTLIAKYLERKAVTA